MRKLVLAGTLFLVLFISACKHGSPKLEGHWKGVRTDGVDPGASITAQAFATSTEIIAVGDKIAIQTQAGRSPTSTYAIDKEDATTLVIHTDHDPTAETFTFNEKADQMTWHVDGQRTIVFKKVP